MTTLFIFILTITLIMPIIMVPQIDSHWLAFEIYTKDRDSENLHMLLKQINKRVMRHLACALTAVILIAVLVYFPGLLEQPAQLASIFGIYAITSLIFAYAESILAQEISNIVAVHIDEERHSKAVHTSWLQ